ncbi:M24 family metallopeptidase [Fuchsiella alkaliacetigena]|uniref:M24 family metallopeptidase n=1 Tax=Fuchsiella alkaliacetigena TaxID=957042 RepID=UPI00200A9022|nr:Xaa-Pro peptidase family protein [Fuchsiella alkaliacetigena]MCK8824213.1 Xaa-Pro peptidase family protein [Fuchsiella alkaliacetigena]
MTLGTMAVDHELRIDYDKLRKDRLRKTREQMEKDGLGALLVYDTDNVRYITSTKLGEWTKAKLNRYCLLAKGQDPILFEIGSAIKTKKKLSPWIKDIRPAKNSMRGSLPGGVETAVKEIASILHDFGLEGEPVGVDLLTVPMKEAFDKFNVNIVDGQQTMLDAQKIKTKEELQLIETSAAMVDGAYADILEYTKPGVKENELAALMRSRLLELGAENVHNVNVISGSRSNPHPHDFSDRIIRPGDLVFLDVVNDFNGYKTCYYRTFCCGKPTEDQKRIYQKAYDWLYDCIEKIKPGAMTDEIARCWPDYKELGYESEYEALALELGHGIGITHWAKPVITRGHSLENPEKIEKNMHFAVETYYGEEGIGGARIEEQVIVTEDGCRVITKFPSDRLISCWDY